MKPHRFRLSRIVLTSVVATVAVAGITACGDDDDDAGGDAQSIGIEVTEKGKGSQYTAPDGVEAGLAEIELSNSGKKTHDLQLVRVEGDHPPADVVRAFAGSAEGKPIPDWLLAGGGIGITRPGQSQTVTQILEPGIYYAFDTESAGPPDPKSITPIDVTGEPSEAELPEADATVRTVDYGFQTKDLESGRADVLFENTGSQPHHVIAAPFAKGKTIEDLRTFLENEQGPPPIDEEQSNVTAVLEGGDSQVLTLDLEPGNYALLCFISDRQGGPPHAFKGMYDAVEVR
jgi:hypothetical protein